MGTQPKTLLVTGFGAFPGVPANPTEALIANLAAGDPLAGAGIEMRCHLLPVTWAMLEAELPALYGAHRPDAVVHFGVAARRAMVCIESRARNAASGLDAAGCCRPGHSLLAPGGPLARSSTLPTGRLVSAVEACGVRARVSRDAGAYLCNATLWTSLAQGIPSVFMHMPLPGAGDPADTRPDAEGQARAARAVLATVSAHLNR
ncbi:peptidase C15 [Breoghania sp. L-A4]|uniref:pyroglutamyl-peptidase I family protein n=1 Tax=Breoghania sp. L-A4 TaxID=2304600 RepID=UPI000E359B96|nr:peptidase C15 [Breoghania sp. L-A4]AXS39885.1 peptidase C15 [Breoghania sp. L-A4]